MKTPRWLLPFTFGVDMRAIDAAVRLAQSAGATLVPVAIIRAPSEGARLEHIQQSKDFLEAVHNKAARHQVPLERYEVFTVDVLASLATLVHDTQCGGIVLVTDGEHTHLMQDEEVKHLLIEPPAALVLIHLPAQTVFTPPLGTRFLSWCADKGNSRKPRCRHGARSLSRNPCGSEQNSTVSDDPMCWTKGGDRHARSTYLTGRG